jgi:hypothetical protein
MDMIATTFDTSSPADLPRFVLGGTAAVPEGAHRSDRGY